MGNGEESATGEPGGFGELVRSRRVAAGLTQEELAERSGLSVRTIRDIERARTVPYRRSMDLLSAVLDLAGPGAAEPEGVGIPAPALADRPGYAGRELVVPRQLPGAVRHFAGRADELTALDRAADVAGTVVISAISGTAGVGKSALAVHWGHRAAGRFPDGQLYVNLRGFEPTAAPVTPAAALHGFLTALSVPPAQIPVSLDERAGLYRSLLAGKRMLIVLDNASDTAQVRPLLPGGAASFVIVTSRSQLAGLAVTDDAHLLALDVLTEAEAREMLARRLGPERLLGESQAARELIGLCARLPLALAIAAARVAAGHPRSLAALVEELRDAADPLDGLDAGDAATSARAVFSWSYRSVSDPAARMFRLLGMHPGPDVSIPAAASLAGVRIGGARGVLKELAFANLLAEHAPGRFTFHDLLRAYAAELVSGSDSDADRRAAMHRLLDYYLRTSWAAEHVVHPTRAQPSLPPSLPGVARTEDFTSYGEALRWLQAEHRVLIATITHAAVAGFDTHSWQMSCALRSFFDRQGHWQDWVASQQIGLGAAQRAGDIAGQAHVHRDLGLAYTRLCSYAEAHAQLGQAVDLYQMTGDRVCEANAHLDVARVFEFEGSPGEALRECESALRLYRKAGQLPGEARALNAIGWYYSLLGNPSQTLIYCQKPLETFRELGDRHAEASTLDSLGYAYFSLGHHQDAINCY
jgi:transcriptional regulator with XRE-family HTH domain